MQKGRTITKGAGVVIVCEVRRQLEVPQRPRNLLASDKYKLGFVPEVSFQSTETRVRVQEQKISRARTETTPRTNRKRIYIVRLRTKASGNCHWDIFVLLVVSIGN